MTPPADGSPGTWREADGSAVSLDEAKSTWAVAARPVLISTAEHYQGYITYTQLAGAVQESTGVRTRSQVRTWIGGVLQLVADDCHQRGEPSLTALAVHSDETVGAGYEYALALTGAPKPADLDLQAAEDRLACYRSFAQDLPEGGGRSALTPKLHAARRRAARLVERPMRDLPQVLHPAAQQRPVRVLRLSSRWARQQTPRARARTARGWPAAGPSAAVDAAL